jgi:hypothetical protein
MVVGGGWGLGLLMVGFDSGTSFEDQLGVLSSNWTMMYVPGLVELLA